jgi:hypothetical protein
MMKRQVISLALVVTIAATTIALLIGATGAAEGETSRVRLAHAVPVGITIDVYVDGDLVESGVAYKDVTPYTVLAAGTHTVTARTLLGDISETVYLTGGLDVTVVGVGAGLLDADTIGLVDDNHLANANTVRVVHVSPNTAAMDVILTGTVGTAEIDALPYKEASDYVGELGTGEVAVEVRAGGTVKTLDPPTATLQSNAIHTLFIMGVGDTLDLVATVDRQFEAVHKILLPLVVK